MSIDWNWFFSSFSQSAAALIGIIGAFIISRLLGLSEKINSTISQFDNLVIEFNKISGSISNRHFYWYNNNRIRYGDTITKALRNGDFNNLTNEEILKKIYELDKLLFKDDDAVLKGFKELWQSNMPKHSSPLTRGNVPVINMRAFDIMPANLWNNLNKEKDTINQLEVESRTLIQRFQQNQQELQSFNETTKPLKNIIIALMISFPLTVLYPLHFMPVAINQYPTITFGIIQIIQSVLTLKSILLFIFFASIEGIFYYFLTLTAQLNFRLAGAMKNNAEKYRDIKSYSKYFNEN